MLLYQDMHSYCYNSDTHFLYDFITRCLEDFKNIQGLLLDVGSGSGILGLLLARDYQKFKLHQVENNAVMQFLSKKNAHINAIDAILHEGDFLKLSCDIQYDWIVSNPPFYSPDVIKSHNPNLCEARYADYLPLESFVQKIKELLSPNGKFAFCYDAKQFVQVIDVIKKNNLTITKMQIVYPKIDKNGSLILVFGSKKGKSQTTILPPIIHFDANDYSTYTKELYAKCATHSIKVCV